ncbi:hypothetical protein K3G39_14710 [Pontibacter sp. HSC-14F20]|uniref:hypothetical protein n=1 Tax=Pontibacter sp. HSC-14F20 TaxID=2864136 RepID=UPI001C73089B|nr:hypothetical protein [Pontibacter sp. HSC-14F20]MBX0334491.1 hypothetical protein [Pontibacter sp. HSC-14F20]
MKRDRIINAFYVLFVLVLVIRLLGSIKAGYEKESWHITEFLINYQGGFVRRGLLGEILYQISQHLHLSPYLIIILLSLIAYLFLIYFFLKSFIVKGYPVFLFPFVFFLGNPIINDFWVRKDVIELLLFIAAMYFITKGGKFVIALVNLFLVIGILIHESIAFFGLPFIFLLLYHRNQKVYTSQARSFVYNISIASLQLLPAFITFISIAYFKGTLKIASSIWRSWNNINFPIEQGGNEAPPAAIDGISWTLAEGLSYFGATIKNFDFDIYAPFAWALIISSIYFILININNLNFRILNYKPILSFNIAHLSSLLIIQLFAVAPLFILGWDYGRWVFLWTSSTFAILLIVPKQTLTDILPSTFVCISAYINRQLNSSLSNSKSFLTLMCLIVGVPSYNWSIIKYVETLAPILILQFLSDTFYKVVVLVKGMLSFS